MTHFKDSALQLPRRLWAKQQRPLPSRWVKTLINGSGKCQMTLLCILDKGETCPSQYGSIAYAKLSLMNSGAVMASFPFMGMTSGVFKALYGAQWLALDAPLLLSAHVLGREIWIAEGRHPLVFVLENWVVLFRPKWED